MELDKLRSHRVGVLMSGGLSSTAIGVWLSENGVETISYIADIGQRAPFAPAALAALLDQHGLKAQCVDLRTQMAETYLDLVRYQATYEGGYWNTTSAARAVLVAGLSDALRADGCTVLVHGCVGGGNDQGRFARYGAALAADLVVFAPWAQPWMRECLPDRRSMADYLLSRGFPAELGRLVTYSIDGNLGGFSHESDELESLGTPSRAATPILTTWPQDAPDEVEAFRVRFVGGRPAEVNDQQVSAVESIRLATTSGGRNGISLRSVVENRVNGTKCRGVYEAPGVEVLGQSLAALYQVTLDKPATELMGLLSAHLGRAAYEGRLYDTTASAAAAAVDVLTACATGTVEIGLYKGNILVNGLAPATDVPGPARQTRFSGGGLHWQV